MEIILYLRDAKDDTIKLVNIDILKSVVTAASLLEQPIISINQYLLI